SGTPKIEGTVSRKGAVCACCQSPVDFNYIREQGKSGLVKEHLCAVIAEGNRGREYLSVDEMQSSASRVDMPQEYPDALLPHNPRDFKTPNYGMTHFSDLFTSRQLVALTTFSSLVADAQKKAEADA